MALKGTPPLPNNNNSNWTLMYVLLGLIPVTFTIIAVYAVWRDTRTPPRDIEMASLPSQRVLPWREAIAASERRTGESPSRPESDRARMMITRPSSTVPVTPNTVRSGGPPGTSMWQKSKGHRGKNVSGKAGAAKVMPTKQPNRKGVLRSMSRISEELEEMPF
ncbi:hypothetical protein F5Y00DRAFT_273652 [Daldinia vernicosa]|uniref:uncharacterized protein n=1 Tax=Daldinia vernicosa TaxID=114800 RepID=UPI002008B381|nr:uncharacterized protein F5Y00DRAFT_273652 [Daldinia vernicosa]KAI0852164.1 hypothetical protein F5Y00DRAFT_273652 [Daldinia vernicosa]